MIRVAVFLVGSLAVPAFLFLASPSFANPGIKQRLEKLEKIITLQQQMLRRQSLKIRRQEKRLKELERRQRLAAMIREKGEPAFVVLLPEGRRVSLSELANLRGGSPQARARVVFPDGTSVTVSRRQADRLIAQVQPKVPTIPTEPPATKKKKAAPKKRVRRRQVRRRRAPPRVQKKQVRQVQKKAPTKKAGDGTAGTRATGKKATDQLLLERGAVLLPRGTLQIEPSVDYAKFSGDRIAIDGLALFNAIIIGTIRVDDLDREILTAQLRARFGITNRLQADLTIPYIYRRDTEVLGVATNSAFENTFTGQGIGDIQAGLTYQVLLGRGWIPATLFRLFGRFPTGEHPFNIPTRPVGTMGIDRRLVRAPTGSGFFAVGSTVTFVYTSDPVAFFFGGGYTANLPRTFSNVGASINPGDSYNFFAGMNVALNERVSLNLSFVNERTLRSTQGGFIVPGSAFNDARVVLGASVALNKHVTLLINTGIGLTEQSPDFSFTVSLPITFRGLLR